MDLVYASVFRLGILLIIGLMPACQASSICPGATVRGEDGSCIACSEGRWDCNADPKDNCETDLFTDPKNCGMCGKICPGTSARRAVCRQGVCGDCPAGSLDCNDNGEDGCETLVNSDISSCGACGKVCPKIPNGVAACVNGRCGLGHCNRDYADCNSDLSDGCEDDIRLDPANCGGCGELCQSTTRADVECQEGTCVVTRCKTGFASCGSKPVQACDTDTRTDVDNCGGCGVRCPFVATQRACAASVCGSQACDAQHADCDAAVPGCETDLQKDPLHCGGCATPCSNSLPNVVSVVCDKGKCLIGQCAPGYAHCDVTINNGCESRLDSDINNCGGCGVRCEAPANTHVATVSCINGQCRVASCQAGFGDCDENINTGCESDLASNVSHCGICNNGCQAPPFMRALCQSSVCQYTCRPGRGDCNQNLSDGCEALLTSSPANCGSCGRRCAMSQICQTGNCI